MTNLLDSEQALGALVNAQRQTNRLLRFSFPRDDGPAGVLLIPNRLDADEGLSRDFRFKVELLSDRPDIALKDVLGKMVTVELVREDASPRYFNGYVFDFRFIRNDAGFSYYEITCLPWLAFLRYRRDNYLFHGKTVQEQTALVFDDYEARDWKPQGLTGDVPMTDACQFDETDYNYLHRRWEALGWHYWYEHRKDGHTLMLGGDSTQRDPIDGSGRIKWRGKTGTTECGLWTFSPIRNVASTAYAASSFDFKAPRPVHADVPTVNQQGELPQMEVYEYAGAYGYKNQPDGDAFVRRRIEEIEAAGKHFEASGDDDRSQCGRTFVLTGHTGEVSLGDDAEDSEFLILEVRHAVTNNYETHEGRPPEYRSTLSCLRKKIPWRPGRNFNSTEPKIYGLQTAIVVGPKGEEIHTDEYGRVRVQFHWDRVGGYDEKSSAWVRVASTWAGANFGFMAVPRIGQEVIVQWLDGNPDRPLVTGRVYNQDNMPPWPLPGSKTQTGILSRSSQGGTYDNANAIRFEDKKGDEQLWLHAEKDQLTEVEHDEDKWVGNDRRKTIDRDETTRVKRDRTETVDRDEKITVHNNRTEQVDHEENVSIGDNRTETVGKNESVTIGDNQTFDVGSNRTKSVGSNESDRIGSNWSIDVGSNKSETIGIASMQNVGLARMENVGLAYSLNVGMIMSTVVGLNKSTNVGENHSVSVGKNRNVSVAEDYAESAGKKYALQAGTSLTVDGKEVTITGKDKIKLQCGASFIEMTPGKIKLDSPMIEINCG